MTPTTMTAAAPAGATSEGISNQARLRAILAGSAGNLIEWYDFYVYAFTALYFSSEFFPKSDPLAQIMATSGIFAVGFLMRPIGGWYFGRFADRHGRQAAMVVVGADDGRGLAADRPAADLCRRSASLAPALLLLGRHDPGLLDRRPVWHRRDLSVARSPARGGAASGPRSSTSP